MRGREKYAMIKNISADTGSPGGFWGKGGPGRAPEKAKGERRKRRSQKAAAEAPNGRGGAYCEGTPAGKD